ncbi:DUF2937 family protein [Marinomonas agarivorans]|nr:DUF2937 family protein [Marinomonas agarivorans]
MLSKMIDKIIFGFALIAALQFPLFAEHYHQFLSGYYKATQQQIDSYENIAKEHNYPNLQAMIEHHLKNTVPSVRSDAKAKLDTLEIYEELLEGMSVFQYGNLAEKSVYIFFTGSKERLSQTLSNFKPGIPLSFEGLGIGVIAGLLINFVITFPFIMLSKRLFARKERKFFEV